MGNKLFCSFVKLRDLEDFIKSLKSKYTLYSNKIFAFQLTQITDEEECICTYNMDVNNLNCIPEDTILIHRKQETNTLYTINSLNLLIKKLNGGFLDKSYKIPWENYSNSILLIQNNELQNYIIKLLYIENVV